MDKFFSKVQGVEFETDDTLTEMNMKLVSEDFRRAFELDFSPVEHNVIESAMVGVLQAVGEDPTREGLQKTPHRVAKMYDELLSGYRTDPAKLINEALFEVDYNDMVIVKNIEFYSLCEHHMLPFYGHVHVAYIPNGKVVGLSKIPRIVDMFAKRLQVQERMTRQIADFINEVLQPQGVAVVVEGVHMCSMMRGVKKADSSMTTSAMLGAFKENTTRTEFLSHVGRASNI
ncbi:MAG: GTP cyclohydrolase I FolE [Pleurocapsa minor GSE-CHR-MK-17-07R]|jgi:GTP cyclohydrolase I|nr:GTP cyclohydrolase I FolE [Pleurocapsa minor GSE-CHR-MK 17-07R]